MTTLPSRVCGLAALLLSTSLYAQATDVDCTKCVDASDLAPQSITSGKIERQAVTTGKLANGAVTRSKLANDSISTNKIRDGAVTLDKVSLQLSNAVGTYCGIDETVVGMDTNGNLVCESKTPGNIEAQVLTAIPLASEVRYLFADYYRTNGAFPLNELEAGALNPAEYANDFVAEVRIADGKVVAEFGNNAAPEISAATLEFVPNITGIDVFFTCEPTEGAVNYFDSEGCVINDAPPEPLTTIRKQIASATPLTSEARWMVEDFYNQWGHFPGSNSVARLEDPENITHRYVTSVSVDTGGEVEATYGNDAHPIIAGGTVTYTATWHGGSFEWYCSFQGISSRYSGWPAGYSACVLPVDSPPAAVSVIRAQIQGGLSIARQLQAQVETYRDDNGIWPTSNTAVGAPLPSMFYNGYLTQATVGTAGTVTLTYGAHSHSEIGGRNIVLTPTDNGGAIAWDCDGPDDIRRFLPWECD